MISKHTSCAFLLLCMFLWVSGQSPDRGTTLKNWVISHKNDPSRLDSSIVYIKEAIGFFKTEENYLQAIECQRLLTNLYFTKANRSQERKEAEQYHKWADSLVIENWELAEQQLSLDLQAERTLYVHSAFNRAYLYLKQDNFVQSMALYRNGLEILEASDSISFNSLDLFSFYITAGNASLGVGDNQQAIDYFKKTWALMNQSPSLDSSLYIPLFTNIGYAFSLLNEMDSSFIYYEKAGKVSHRNRLPRIHQRKGEILPYVAKALSFQSRGNPDSAFHAAHMALILLEESDSPELKSRCYTTLGSAYLDQGKLAEAKQYLKQSQEINLPSNYDYSHETAHTTYLTLGKLHLREGNQATALKQLYQALELNRNSPQSSPLAVEDYIYQYRTLEVLGPLVDALSSFSEPDSSAKAIQYVAFSQQLLNKVRQSFQSEGSKLNLARKSHPLFEKGLAIQSSFAMQNPSYADISDVLPIIESSKSILLYEALREREAQALIPPSQLQKERRYKRTIAYTEKALYDSNRKQKKNQDQLLEELYSHRQQFQRFQDSLEQDYPSYYQQKFQLDLASLEDLQAKLNPEEVFIQYFMGDTHIYGVGIHPQKEFLHQIPLTQELTSALHTYLQILTSAESVDKGEDSKKYLASGYLLYQQLLEPILNQFDSSIHSLILSPDGMLNFIPFDAFLTQKPPQEWRYADLPYLIQRYSLSYTHSATHWIEQQEKKVSRPPNTWLGVAPRFSEDQIQESIQPLAMNRFLTREGSVQLPYAEEEVRQIASYISGEELLKETALESHFHSQAPKYQILHLATHGIIEDQNPMYSKLAFAPESDSSFDGFLHAYEIYNMQLPANLVVLSACNTGIGKLERGEGIMSLSRAFFYAGVKSILMSLWSVSDESTAELMVSFYTGLKQGLDKDKALQQAKLSYLKNQELAMKSHPYFWAGFVLKGDAGALSLKSSWGYWGYFLLGFLVLLGLVFGVRSSRKKLGD